MNRVPASLAVVMLAASGHPVSPITLRSWVYRGHISRQEGGYDLREILTYLDSRESHMTKHVVNITQKPSGVYQVVLDGTDIANACSGLTVDMGDPSYPPTVTVTMPIHIGLSVAAEVVVDQRTHSALVHLGWSPPAAS